MKDLTIETVEWTEQESALREIRRQVFIVEQRIPKELEWDGLDPDCVHFLAVVDDKAAGTSRLAAGCKFERMAVLREYRQHGIGSALLDHMIAFAREQGEREAALHAQESAVSFYEKHDFRKEGEPFEEAGIIHFVMRRAL